MFEERLLLKVCGMRDAQNIREIAELQPDYLGFIFYEASKRNAKNTVLPEQIQSLPPTTQAVLVSVDALTSDVKRCVDLYGFRVLQMHGKESPETCAFWQKQGFQVWKAISIAEAIDFEQTNRYLESVDAFLFDTKGRMPGGNGYAFDWDLLQWYKGSKPFWLSGGISPLNMQKAISIAQNHPLCLGLDVNSGFELAPGLKHVSQIQALKAAIDTIQHG